jgi:hypothetical protein
MKLVIGPVEKTTHSSQERFVMAVEQALEGPFIRYSKRLQLLELAKDLNINRFQANLLIAQVLNRNGGLPLSVSDPYESAEEPKMKPETPAFDWRERFYFIAALFILAAIVDLALVKFVFSG